MKSFPQPSPCLKHDDLPERLEGLAREIASVARNMRSEGAEPAKGSKISLVDLETNLAKARMLLAIRRLRDQLFPQQLLGEPSWNILLDLYVADIEDRPISVSSACLASAAPATTGLRHLDFLVEQGLVVREADKTDKRRIFVKLSPGTRSAFESFMKRLTV